MIPSSNFALNINENDALVNPNFVSTYGIIYKFINLQEQDTKEQHKENTCSSIVELKTNTIFIESSQDSVVEEPIPLVS